MTAMARIKLSEAELHVEDALARCERRDEYSPSVAIAHATDALILGVDALCHAAKTEEPRRHGDAPRIFLELIRTGHLPPEASSWRELISKAMHQRASFQYHGELIARGAASRFVQKVAQFVVFVRGQVDRA